MSLVLNCENPTASGARFILEAIVNTLQGSGKIANGWLHVDSIAPKEG